jgi:hypothetical protein
MRILSERWRSLSDAEIDGITEKIIGIHWLMMGFVTLGWTLLPLVLGVSREVLVSRLW